MIESAFPIITTPDLERALGFYRDLLGGVVSFTFPPEGPPGYVGVDLGSSHLGIGHDPAVDLAGEQRIALWVYTADCDAVVDGGAGGRRHGRRGARRPAVGRARRPRRWTPTATASSSAPARLTRRP